MERRERHKQIGTLAVLGVWGKQNRFVNEKDPHQSKENESDSKGREPKVKINANLLYLGTTISGNGAKAPEPEHAIPLHS